MGRMTSHIYILWKNQKMFQTTNQSLKYPMKSYEIPISCWVPSNELHLPTPRFCSLRACVTPRTLSSSVTVQYSASRKCKLTRPRGPGSLAKAFVGYGWIMMDMGRQKLWTMNDYGWLWMMDDYGKLWIMDGWERMILNDYGIWNGFDWYTW